MPNPDPILSPLQVQADAALALELVGRFFSEQVEAGAATRDGVARLIREAGNAVADRMPGISHHVCDRAAAMANALPDEWQEPA